MPRPQKATAEYFQHSIKKGKTIFTLEAKYGNDGYALWFKTLELLTATEHHYLDFNDEALWEYYLTVVSVNDEQTKEILNLLAKLNAIDAELWKHKVIWCENLIHSLSALYNKRTVQPLNKSQILAVFGAETPNIGINDSDKPHRREENTIEENSIAENTTISSSSSSSLISSYDEDICKNDYELLYHVYKDIKELNSKHPLVTGNAQPHSITSMYSNIKNIYKLCNNDLDTFILEMQSKMNQPYWAGEIAKTNCNLATVIGRFTSQLITDLQTKKEKQEKKPAYNYNDNPPMPTYKVYGDDDDE